MTIDEAEKLVDVHVAKLAEQFEAVQIMISVVKTDGTARTMCVKRGCGNWYARQGMAHEFIETDKAQETANAIAPLLSPPGDDSGAWKRE